ncbi:peptide-methionine (S)-S-oxide reductase, partial [bacterium]
QHAVLAGGCFWCTEGVFEQIPGVSDVESIYAGGTKETANYEAVCSGTTGHAEAIRITYDPAKVTYGYLLKIFFSIAHDPTTLNRQGNDVGTQYRSAVFYANDEEKRVAEAYIKQLTDAKVFTDPITTTLEPLTAYYPAEKYHQDYAKANPDQGYIRAMATPKIEKAKKVAAMESATTQPADGK